MGILGKMGGLASGLIAIFTIVVYPFREVLYYRKLINENFHVCTKKSDIQEAIGFPKFDQAEAKSGQSSAKFGHQTSVLQASGLNS
jgi:hypothetical protein